MKRGFMFLSLFVPIQLTFDKHLFPACSDPHWKDAVLVITPKKRQKTIHLRARVQCGKSTHGKGFWDITGKFASNSLFFAPKHETWLKI